MKRTFCLRRRLMLSMSLIFFLGLGASISFFYLEVQGTVGDLRERTLQGQARDLLANARLDQAGRLDVTEPRNWAKVYAEAGSAFAYTLYDGSGAVVARSANLTSPLPLIGIPQFEPFGAVEFTGVGAAQHALLAAKAPGRHVLVVSRTRPDPEMLAESILFEENFEHFLVFLPFILLSILLIWLISGRSLQPLQRASGQAALAGPANPTVRIETDGLPSEVLPLVDAVNAALDRLAQAYVAEQRLTVDAAHELRTPLAVLSLRLQRARQGELEWSEIDKDVAKLTRIVGQLLDLARRERAGQPTQADMARVNIARIVREASAQILPLAEAAGRRLDVDAPEVVEVRGQADDLRDMIVNLLDNALTHGAGAIISTLRADCSPDTEEIILEVSDEGPGVQEGLKEEAFDRFRKGRSNSPGAGLGLAIVRQIARNHGGGAYFPPHAGSTVRVNLPLYRAP